MELLKAIEERASVRHYTKDAVPINDLKKMAEYAAKAPSVAGSELWRFTAITNRELLDNMAKAVIESYDELIAGCNNVPEGAVKTVETFSTFFKNAPAVIAVFIDEYDAVIDNIIKYSSIKKEDIEQTRRYPSIQSVGAAIENLLLTAQDMGYGACWLTGPLVAREKISELIPFNKGKELVAMVAIGKALHAPTQKQKRPIEEIFTVVE